MGYHHTIGGIYGTESFNRRDVLRSEAVARPYRWNKIPNQGGRTLVNGTGYDIKLGHEEIWVIENVYTLPAEAIGDFSAVVICDGIEYIRIKIVSITFGIYRQLQLYKNDGTYDIYSDRVQMTFPTPPTGELLTWLETYAEKQ